MGFIGYYTIARLGKSAIINEFKQQYNFERVRGLFFFLIARR